MKKSYASKFLFVAFVGIHLPLIMMLFFILYGNFTVSANTIFIFSLVVTIVASGITLFLLKRLIKPIGLASTALEEYRKDRTFSFLPAKYYDQAGLLMRNINETIQDNENFIQEKQDLIYLLSHDLKNFAGNPQSLAMLILEENPSESIKELAELIYQSGNQQFQYIENIIKLLKEQDEVLKGPVENKTIRFYSVVAYVESQVARLLKIKRIKLNTFIEVDKLKLKIDQELLIRVLVNLIDNAIKFSFPDSVITLRIYFEKEKLYVAVMDHGIGFEQSKSEELFKKFTMMSQLGTSNEASTGIGLYLCRKIIEKNLGRLEASSRGKNKGAIFTISFDG
ncbi:sensor histidine kinase [Flavobacterium sp. Arc2]|uniref:sensor histidine kinase n=1 Tax=Flavobacterium sp. Arc2 TaxID=3046685 RepID=UPI00352DEE75